MRESFFLLIFSIFFITNTFAQKGPGGISTETSSPTDSDVKVWYNIGKLNVADGASVDTVKDYSLSINQNYAYQDNISNQPVYRNAVAASINGQPIIKFLSSDYLKMISSSDINTGGYRTQRTMSVVFRTSSDITSPQILYEQGGGIRGLNIYIYNDSVYVGGYDFVVDGDGTPSWGWTGQCEKIEAYSTYIVSYEYNGSAAPDTAGYIVGRLNGVPFSTDINPNTAGQLASHGGQPGIGAKNGSTIIHTNTNPSGLCTFLGDFAEFISYSHVLNDAEKIILDNYLGAKYLTSVLGNDKYVHQVSYPEDVIGVGQESTGNNHLVSQGLNPFIIEVQDTYLNDGDYLLMGHDGGAIDSWTSSKVSSKINTQSIERVWKVDHTNDVGQVLFSIDSTMLPALPANNIYVAIIDASGGAVPNFDNARVIELSNGGSGNIFSNSIAIHDNAYITIGVVSPTAYFENNNSSDFETEIDKVVSVEASLNYEPYYSTSIDFTRIDNTAQEGEGLDYNNFSSSGPIYFISGNDKTSISFEIEGDAIGEATEDFTIRLLATGTISVTDEELLYTIFDNDNTDTISIDNSVAYNFNENPSGVYSFNVIRNNASSSAMTVDVRIGISNSGTASENIDYVFNTTTVSFITGVSSVPVNINISDDNIYEGTETIIVELFNNSSNSMIHPIDYQGVIQIIDDEVEPTVSFEVATGSGAESFGSPIVNVLLSHPTTTPVSVDYVISGGTATPSIDYFCPSTGTLSFDPEQTTTTIPLTIVSDSYNENDETIIFELNTPSAGVSILGTSTFTYTVMDYVPYEWTGVAGVGTSKDNVFFIDASQQNKGQVSILYDASDNANHGLTGGPVNRVDGAINGKSVLSFDGSTNFQVGNLEEVNNYSLFMAKDIIMVIKPNDVSTRQILWSQGGGTRGLVLYLESGNIRANIYNNTSENGNDAWGTGSATGDVSVVGATNLIAGQSYIINMLYDGAASNTIELYIDGVLDGSITKPTMTGDPFMGSHGSSTLAGLQSGVKVIGGSSSGNNFNGDIAEFIYYNDSKFNISRRVIVENYLSNKYDISIANQVVETTDAYSYDAAGIGMVSTGDKHLDAQGGSRVRINNPSDLNVGEYLFWAHDNEENSYYPDSVDVPAGIDNRFHRVWRVYNTGDVGTVDLTFTGLNIDSITSGGHLELLLDEDGTFSNAHRHTTGRVYNPSAGTVTFTNVVLTSIFRSGGHFFTLGSSNSGSVLPVELISFTANLEDEKVVLDWSTATEKNNDYFIIEKSADGYHFEEFAIVDGLGTKNTTTNYSIVDNYPYDGVSYYKLIQVDFDGTRDELGIRAVNVSAESKVFVYPNPTNLGEVYTLNVINYSGQVEVEAYDLTGRKIFNYQFDGSISDKVILESSIFKESGLYILNIKTDKLEQIKLRVQ